MSSTLKQAQLEQDIKTRTSIFNTFKIGDNISVSIIQRTCSVGYFSAYRVLENLIEDGFIKQIKGTFGKMLVLDQPPQQR